MRPDGSEMRLAITPVQWAHGGHHMNWTADGEHLSINLNVDNKDGLEFVTVRYEVFASTASGEFRIDPHPAWDQIGRYAFFNGFVGCTRNVWMGNLKEQIQ